MDLPASDSTRHLYESSFPDAPPEGSECNRSTHKGQALSSGGNLGSASRIRMVPEEASERDIAAVKVQAAIRGASARETVEQQKVAHLKEAAARGSARAQRQLSLAVRTHTRTLNLQPHHPCICPQTRTLHPSPPLTRPTPLARLLLEQEVAVASSAKGGASPIFRRVAAKERVTFAPMPAPTRVHRTISSPILEGDVTEVLPQRDTGLLSGVKTQAVASAVAERLLRRPRERHVFTDLQFTTEVEESEFSRDVESRARIWPASAPHLPRIWPASGPHLARIWPASAPYLPRICPVSAPHLPRFCPASGPHLARIWLDEALANRVAHQRQASDWSCLRQASQPKSVPRRFTQVCRQEPRPVDLLRPRRVH